MEQLDLLMVSWWGLMCVVCGLGIRVLTVNRAWSNEGEARRTFTFGTILVLAGAWMLVLSILLTMFQGGG